MISQRLHWLEMMVIVCICVCVYIFIFIGLHILYYEEHNMQLRVHQEDMHYLHET